ncbi:hypothetical protein QE436_001140 [Pantoea anthophila]|nr:hypothetical protein [Pantoea anthophila]
MLPLSVVWQTSHQQRPCRRCSSVRLVRVGARESCNSQARSLNGPVFCCCACFQGRKDEKNLSILHGHYAPALLQCLAALFLVQACSEKATNLIKNSSRRLEICLACGGRIKKCRLFRLSRARNLTEKKLFLRCLRRREKLYTADGGGAAITYPLFLWITLCIR